MDFFYAMYSNQDIMQYIGRPLTKAQANKQLHETIKVMQTPDPHHLTYVIVHGDKQDKIGITGLTWFDQNNRGVAEVGIMISPDWRRQHWGHQSKKMMISAAFEDFKIDVVYAFCQINNVAANAANEYLKLLKGRQIKAGVNQQLSQEWSIEKSSWIDSNFR